MGRAQGWEAGPNMLGKVIGEVRRAFSFTLVRAQALCLLERLPRGGRSPWGWRRGGGGKGRPLPWPTREEALAVWAGLLSPK